MSNYTTYKLGDKTLGIKFGLPALRRMAESFDKYPVVDADGSYNPLGVAHIIYSGYLNNLLIKEQEPDSEVLGLLVDQLEMGWAVRFTEPAAWDEAARVVTFMAESMLVKSLTEDNKKKLTEQTTETMKIPTTIVVQMPRNEAPQPTGTL